MYWEILNKNKVFSISKNRGTRCLFTIDGHDFEYFTIRKYLDHGWYILICNNDNDCIYLKDANAKLIGWD